MIIGFDGKRAVSNFTGLGNYSRFIINSLNTYFPDNKYTVFAPKKRENPEYDSILKDNTSTIYPEEFISKWLPSLWRTRLINKDIKRLNIELYHGLSNELPEGIENSGIKSVVTIHDLIFLRYPQYYKPIDRKIYNYKFKRACLVADKIIAVSECTKQDIINYYSISPSKIEVVYQGCHNQFKQEPTEAEIREVRERYDLPQNFILNVGTIEERKNLMLLASALKFIPKDIHLVAAGRRTPYTTKVEEFCRKNGLSKRLHLLEGVPFYLLPALYRQADIFAYTSRFEGFGIPIIEAISCGLPVVATTGSCLEEAGGKGALYVNQDDIEGTAEAICKIIDDETMRRNLVELGKEHIKKFSPNAIASETDRVYREVLSRV